MKINYCIISTMGRSLHTIPAARSLTSIRSLIVFALILLLIKPSMSFIGCAPQRAANGVRLRRISRSVFLSSSSSASSTSSESLQGPLPFSELPYRGAEIRVPTRDESDGKGDDFFLARLRASLDHWKQNDFTSAWLHVPASRSSLVESLTESSLSFDLHHVNATESTIVLKEWLRPNAEDKIPPFASHQVGCAGFVLSDDNEILLVREWSGSPSNRTPTKQWKLPGGLLDSNETLGEAACRETIEETGVACEFESVLAFWHRHGLIFGKSDLYYVCLLRPKTKDIVMDSVEVSDATWMPIDEFLKTQKHPLILHVLRNAFQLGDGDDSLDKLINATGRITPALEMAEGQVQFENRAPYLTYTGASR